MSPDDVKRIGILRNENIEQSIWTAIRQARQPRHRREGAWVAFCHSIFALSIGVLLWTSYDFNSQALRSSNRNQSGVVGWVSVHQYPKQQEMIAYVGAFGSVILGVVGGWFVWCILALCYSRWRRCAMSRSLRRTAWLSSGYLIAFIPLLSGRWSLPRLLLIPFGCALLTGVVLWFWRKPHSKNLSGKWVDGVAVVPDYGSQSGTAATRSLPTKTDQIGSKSSDNDRNGSISTTSCTPSPTLDVTPDPFRLPTRPRWRQIIIYYILIPLLLYLYLFNGQSIHHSIDLFHEGERLAPLNALLRGGIPFRNIYIQHGLFQNVGKVWLAALLGSPSLASLRLTERFIAPLGYIAIYLLGLQVFRFWPTALVLALITSSQNFWISDRHALGLLAVATLVYALRRGRFDRISSEGDNPYCRRNQLRRRSTSLPLNGSLSTPNSTTRQFKAWWHSVFTNGWSISAGILTTLAFFYSTEVGLYTFAACGLFFVLRSAWCVVRVSLSTFPFPLSTLRNTSAPLHLCTPFPFPLSPFAFCSYFTGVLIGGIPFLIYFGWYGAIDDLISNSIIQCIYQIPTWGLPYPSILPSLQKIVSFTTFKEFLLSETFRWYLPVIVYLITAGILVFRAIHSDFWRNSFNAVLLLVLLNGIMLFRTALGRSDGGHIIYGSTLFWVFILIALESGITHCIQRVRALQNAGWLLWITALALFIFGWYVNSVHHPLKVMRDRTKAIMRGQTLPKAFPVTWARLGGLQINEAQISHLRRVVDAIQQRTQPDEPIFDFSSQGAYYFFADRPSATRYHQIAYASTLAMQKEVIRDLERTRTRLVIYRTGGWFDNIDGIPATERHALIARYLDRHYTKAVDIDGTVILLRNP